MNGPSLDSVVKMINTRTMANPVVKVAVDSDYVWADMLAMYKQFDNLTGKYIQVTLDDSPVIDTRGVGSMFVHQFMLNSSTISMCVYSMVHQIVLVHVIVRKQGVQGFSKFLQLWWATAFCEMVLVSPTSLQ